MAVAAEALREQKYELSQGRAEASIVFPISSERTVESEIYGRSLSTIYRFGAFAVEHSTTEAIYSPESEQARVEFFTSVEEGFGTDMELGGGLEVRDFDLRPVINGKVMAKDLKTSVSEMTQNGLVCAEEKAKWDEHFLPQLTRSIWDHRNALVVDGMARGETNYNTRIVVSPFPEEAAKRSGDKYWRGIGYVPHLRRGFVQLYYGNEEGLLSGSLSFDGSNKEKLVDVFAELGIDIPENEVTDNWLQYALTDTLSESEARALATKIADRLTDPKYKKETNTVDVTAEHRTVINKVFDESYVHACESLAKGKQTPGARDLIMHLADQAEHFNDRYKDALYRMRVDESKFSDDDMVVLHELLVYSTIEMMRALHLKKVESFGSELGMSINTAYLQTLDTQAFQHMLGGFGGDGARNNRTYSACGLAISLGENDTNMNPQSAFGDVDSKTESKSDMKCVSCPECKTFHEKVRFVNGKPVCDNSKCKLSDKKA